MGLVAPLSDKKASLVKDAIIELLGPIKDLVKTLTFDNDQEFTPHEEGCQKLGCNSYLAKPDHSWQRGQNENANGLLGHYFSKSMKHETRSHS